MPEFVITDVSPHGTENINPITAYGTIRRAPAVLRMGRKFDDRKFDDRYDDDRKFDDRYDDDRYDDDRNYDNRNVVNQNDTIDTVLAKIVSVLDINTVPSVTITGSQTVNQILTMPNATDTFTILILAPMIRTIQKQQAQMLVMQMQLLTMMTRITALEK